MSEKGARHKAKLAGESRYFTSKPCSRGHISERMTDSGVCMECRRELERERYKENYEKKIKPRRSTPKALEAAATKMAKIRASMPEEKKQAYRERAKLKAREWRKKNPGHRNALKRKYVADKANRTPRWADLQKINNFYKNCPPGHHVDHIVPLRAKNASGLHVHHNLQYLPAHENMRKNNRFEVI